MNMAISMLNRTTSSPVTAAGSMPITDAAPRLLTSQNLLQGAKTVAIEHNGSVYQLRATKFGKLILTK